MDEQQTVWSYDPHIDPALQFDTGRSSIETLIDDALASGDQDAMRLAVKIVDDRGTESLKIISLGD